MKLAVLSCDIFVALNAHHKNYEKFHKIMNENMFSFTFLCIFSCICKFGIFVCFFMKFSPKCRTKKLGMIYTILGNFCLFLAGLSLWLMMSYCDCWMSVVRRVPCVVRRHQLLLQRTSPKRLTGF